MTCYQKCLITTRSKPSLISFVTSEQFFVISYKLYAKVLFMIGCQRKSHVCFRNFLLFYSISIDSVLVLSNVLQEFVDYLKWSTFHIPSANGIYRGSTLMILLVKQ